MSSITVYCYSHEGIPIYRLPFTYPCSDWGASQVTAGDVRAKLGKESQLNNQLDLYDVSASDILVKLRRRAEPGSSESVFSPEDKLTFPYVQTHEFITAQHTLLAIPVLPLAPQPLASSSSSVLIPPPPMSGSKLPRRSPPPPRSRSTRKPKPAINLEEVAVAVSREPSADSSTGLSQAITEDDIASIREMDWNAAPQQVRRFARSMARPRQVTQETFDNLQAVNASEISSLFSPPSAPMTGPETQEDTHYRNLISWKVPRKLKEPDIHEMYWNNIKAYIDDKKGDLQFSKRWPYHLGVVIKLPRNPPRYCWYQPCSESSIFHGYEPYLLVEVDSNNNDRERMLLYAAMLVRWFSRNTDNIFVVLPLLYIWKPGLADLIYMYTDKNEVYYVEKRLFLDRPLDRLTLAATLYNIIDKEPELSDFVRETSETLRGDQMISKSLMHSQNTDSTVPSLPQGRKRERGKNKDDGRNGEDQDLDQDNRSHKRKKWGNNKPNNKPEDDGGGGDEGNGGGGGREGIGSGGGGEGSGGGGGNMGRRGGGGRNRRSGGQNRGGAETKWPAQSTGEQRKRARQPDETPSQLPVDVLTKTGYNARFEEHEGQMLLHAQKKRSRYIVKYGRNSAPEMQFFSRKLRHPNIIHPVEILKTHDFMFAVLPMYNVLKDILTHKTPWASRFLNMTYDMARGGQFLHDNGVAHMDIKPDNLVYDTHFNLRYIDFDLALSVKDEEEQTNGGIRGSSFWMAPEVNEGPYSPIRADRYSCGVVFEEMAGVVQRTMPDLPWIQSLYMFSEKLQFDNPSQRPPLIDWISTSQ